MSRCKLLKRNSSVNFVPALLHQKSYANFLSACQMFSNDLWFFLGKFQIILSLSKRKLDNKYSCTSVCFQIRPVTEKFQSILKFSARQNGLIWNYLHYFEKVYKLASAAETDGTIGIVSKVPIPRQLVSVSVSIQAFLESRYQYRYGSRALNIFGRFWQNSY